MRSLFRRSVSRSRPSSLGSVSYDPPIQYELMSLEQLRGHAQELARWQKVDLRGGRNTLLARLDRNERGLREVRDLLAGPGVRRIEPAAEWLIDNFYLVEQQIRIARMHLPRSYVHELPRLRNKGAEERSRVYDMALELISHVDGSIDTESAQSFVEAYQTVAPLKLGELWAFPIMLRLALIENLRRVADQVAVRRRDRDLAIVWSERIVRAAEVEPRKLIQILADLDRSQPPFGAAFIQEFIGRLQGQKLALDIVLQWVDHELAEQGLTTDQILRADSQEQAASRVSVANNLGSLRFLGSIDWRDFVEGLSLTEQVLRRDPAGAYAGQEFETRDRCRHAVEDIAARSPFSEEEVAAAAIQLAQESVGSSPDGRRMDFVGYYLIGEGRRRLEKKAGRRRSSGRPSSGGRTVPLALYLTPILALTGLVGGAMALAARQAGLRGIVFWIAVVAALIAGSLPAISITNTLSLKATPPRLLPRLDFSRGIPPDHRTIAVIPCLLTGPAEALKLVEDLEIRYLANRDPNLFFGLLTDFTDADKQDMPEDAALVALTREKVEDLNRKHAPTDGRPCIFFFFHRKRTWNPHERIWMGYERKRGKLEQFNALLRGGSAEPFRETVGDMSQLPSIKYVITLDRDTHLTRDAGARLAGTMAHPLNRPLYDPKKGRVVRGHGILQPRVSVRLTSANRSIFARLASGDAGIDPYTREVSDVYQDLFDEGSFVGKGIYDVDAFRSVTAGRFPENLILSHDLIEGCFARSALVTDIELVEDLPCSYAAEAQRRDRWTRGDWQIAGWILPWARDASGRRRRNPLTLLSRWKILDNLRRSLVAPALAAGFVAGIIAAPDRAGLWSLFPLAVLLTGPSVCAVLELLNWKSGLNGRILARSVARDLARGAAQALLALSFLPYDAMVLLRAITGSSARLAVFRFSRRGLLRWYSRDHGRKEAKSSLWDFLGEMWIEVAAGAGLAFVLAGGRPSVLACAGPFAAAWLAGPVLGWWISRPFGRGRPPLTEIQLAFLRGLARRSWTYFETFVGAGGDWLPPDNLQETPEPRIAKRTSPTNMGMNLQANVAALDLGYISLGRFLQRTELSLTAMEALERFRGHFLNWYDTETRMPLKPRYVSAVDSGNLLGSLVVLREALRELKTRPLIPAAAVSGLHDGLEAVASALGELKGGTARLIREFRDVLGEPAAAPGPFLRLLERARGRAAALAAATLFGGDGPAHGLAESLEKQIEDCREDLLRLMADPAAVAGNPSLQEFARLPTAGPEAGERLALIEALEERAGDLEKMDFDFLYDSDRDLLSIGYRVDEHRRDPSFYDLLASEARFASFVLIARGVLPQRHWFSMSRLLTRVDGGMALLSWSGSMFEYLMPLIWLPMVNHTLLDQTYRAVVNRQRTYGRDHGVPWGISESCSSATDASLTYQYGAFGVPGLGFKRDLGEDLVIAPYAAVLALMVAPGDACRNLQRMAGSGFLGRYGFYEAIDYTSSRLARGQPFSVVKVFMTHHLGMSLLSLENVLLGGLMQKRFMGYPAARATERLLHERVPAAGPSLQPTNLGIKAPRIPESDPVGGIQVFSGPSTPVPEVQLLSNGAYHVMTTASGGGFSRWRDLSLTRWREDAACDGWGTFIYLREAGGPAWSVCHQPTCRPGDAIEAVFAPARTEYRRRERKLESYVEIAVSPEDDVEIRKLRISNLSDWPRTVEVTTYAEVVLDTSDADLSHRVFSNLFVETEIVADREALLVHRRKRRPEDPEVWMLHFLAASEAGLGPPSYETDREIFLGRGRSVGDPAALDPGQAGKPGEAGLSNSQGAVLDPIVAMRRAVRIPADGTALFHVVSGAAGSRQEALALIDKYRDSRFVDRSFEMAWSHNQVMLRNLGATESEARAFDRLAGSILFAGRLHRAPANVISGNTLGQPALWRFGVSGDLPIVLVRIRHAHGLDLVRSCLKAHAYWRAKGLRADLVILNNHFSGYRQALQEEILRLIQSGPEAHQVDKRGGVFLRRGEELSEDERNLFQAVARVVLTDTDDSLADMAAKRPQPERWPPALRPERRDADESSAPLPSRELVLGNGTGGFTPDGREYVIMLEPGRTTPAPWCNVIASPQIGTVVSESGSAVTWVENAHEFRLTTWYNDPVSDPTPEAFYIRDEQSGRFWSPMPQPAPGRNGTTCRHGFGYTVFEHYEAGIFSETWIYVAVDEPVKYTVVRLRNDSGRKRRLALTGYWELAMGEWRHLNQMHIVTSFDPETGAVLARNAYSRDFGDRVVFAAASETNRTVTGNKIEFLGRNGSLASPAAMGRTALSGRIGAGLDPCAAITTVVDLAEGEEKEVVFVLGAGRGEEDALRLARDNRRAPAARRALEAVWALWNHLLDGIHVESPDPAFNVLVNGWLAYQTISSRLWGRGSFYQSSGAYGFRDQLQDAVSLVAASPSFARDQILRCAEHQFREGDVQHWWHPPAGRGVRTHISDDMLWLPYAVSRYIEATGDVGLLEERRAFLVGRPLDLGEEAHFDLWQRSDETGTVYEHCVRAIRQGLSLGPHGLPLIGSGDWNDGMNLVGRAGRGESVWLAWFLFGVLSRFTDLADSKGDHDFAQFCRISAEKVRAGAEAHGWDGRWYRRAYLDDGRPLGSILNTECQIDSLPQSWAVISGGAAIDRARLALRSTLERLYRPKAGLIKLLDPPFDISAVEPGYIKGYPPGFRENGGHYTHAGAWVALALALIGDKAKAWEMFAALNPVRHGDSPEKIGVYKVEPYSVAADIITAEPRAGRGGWTWYTGSAGWMFRIAVETLLGLQPEAGRLRLAPLLPEGWNGCRVNYRYKETFFHIEIKREGGTGDRVARVILDGQETGGPFLPLADDRTDHVATVIIGPSSAAG